MSSIFKYDALDILDRAEKSAGDWWGKTLDNAKRRTDLDQQHFDNAFKNDKQLMTYGSDLFKTNSENTYKGTKAQYDTMLEPDRYDTQKSVYGRDNLRAQDETWQLENAMSPTNRAARTTVYNDRFQSPAAALGAGVASAGIADTEQAALAARDAAAMMPGALSAQATYGRAATQAGSLNLANDIATGNFERANQALAAGGFNMKIMPAQGAPGKVVVVDEQGRSSMPMDPSAVEAQFRDRTATKQGNTGAYVQGAESEQRKFTQQTMLSDARIAQRDRNTQARMSNEMGKRLTERLKNARTEEERTQAQDDLDAYLAESPAGRPLYGGASSGGGQAPDAPSMRSIMMGAPPAQAAQPARAAAPAAAAQSAPAAQSSVYKPPQSSAKPASKTYRAGEVSDDVMAGLNDSHAQAQQDLKQVQIDWQRANSLEGRRAVSDEMRANIKKALDAAKTKADAIDADRAAAKRAYQKDKGEKAYNPYRSMQEAGADSMNLPNSP